MLDFETKIGQLFIVTPSWTMRNDAPDRAGHLDRDFLRRYRPAGLLIRAPMVRSRGQIARYLADLQMLNRDVGLPGPLVVCADHRGGNTAFLRPQTGGLEFPAPMAQTALPIDDIERAGTEIGAAVARDVLDVGLNLNLAPYADFLARGDIEGFKFGHSMMGGDPRVNARLAAALVQGMHAEGLGTTYCGFPGGYGSFPKDPHLFPGTIMADRMELESRYFPAPRAAIAAGVDAIMTSHFAFPALDSEARPATYSEPILRSVLRDEFGFTGLVLTDSIRMRGVADVAGTPGEAAVRAIMAGADIVLLGTWETRQAVANAVRDGRISERRLDEAVERVLALKARLTGDVPRRRREPDPTDTGRMAYWIERALSWARRPPEWQPIGTADAPRVVAVGRWADFLDAAGDVGGHAVATIWLAGPDPYRIAGEENDLRLLTSMTEAGDRVLFGSVSATDLALARRLSAAGREVWVAHGGSVLDVDQAGELPLLLVTYSTGPLAARKAVETFYGLAHPHGRVPVAFPLTVDTTQ